MSFTTLLFPYLHRDWQFLIVPSSLFYTSTLKALYQIFYLHTIKWGVSEVFFVVAQIH